MFDTQYSYVFYTVWIYKLSVECGCAVVRASVLESQGCEFDSHWVSALATLGKLLA